MKTLMMLMLALLVAACTYNNDFEKEDDTMGMGIPGSPGNRKKGWSASNKLTQNSVTVRSTAEVSLQADFADPGPYVAQFRLSGDLRGKRAQAEITWSVQGNQVRRLVSISDGTSIQGAGEAVSIKIRDVSDITVITIGTGEYVASVNVVRGTRGSAANPPTLDGGNVVNVGNGVNHLFDVPQETGVISVAFPLISVVGAGPIPDDSVSVEQYDDSLNTLTAYDPRQYFWMPLAPGCTKIGVRNSSGIQIVVKPIFGIDG